MTRIHVVLWACPLCSTSGELRYASVKAFLFGDTYRDLAEAHAHEGMKVNRLPCHVSPVSLTISLDTIEESGEVEG